ncbi:MAG: hypothetical protein ABW185_26285 [Sedimenticola sp.]
MAANIPILAERQRSPSATNDNREAPPAGTLQLVAAVGYTRKLCLDPQHIEDGYTNELQRYG